jgi:hypothetical protein
MTDIDTEAQRIKDFFRRTMRRDGEGPYPDYFSGNTEHVHIDEGETVIDAMLDHPSPVVVYVAKHGQEWTDVQGIPDPMGAQACYGNARLYAKVRGCKYVEGWAESRIIPNMWVRHAWVLDEDGQALEVTWDEPGHHYVGVVFKSLPKKKNYIAITDEFAWGKLEKEQ